MASTPWLDQYYLIAFLWNFDNQLILLRSIIKDKLVKDKIPADFKILDKTDHPSIFWFFSPHKHVRLVKSDMIEPVKASFT